MGQITLVTGGAKSGKSTTAQHQIIQGKYSKVAYIATQANQFIDQESEVSIAKHQSSRPSTWRTYEVFYHLDKLIEKDWNYEAVIIDCLTLWLSNHIFFYMNDFGWSEDFDALSKEETQKIQAAIELELDRLILAMQGSSSAYWIVSNEVGQGIVPENQLSRYFRNLQGIINQKLASQSDSVFWVVSGIPVKIKGGN